MKLAFGAAIMAAVAQAAVPYTNCGTSADLLSNVVVNATPDPPVPGKAVDIDVTGTLSTAVKSGKYTLSVAYDGITIITKTGDLSSLTTLPVAAGPLKVAKSETLPSSVPAGSYTAKISATANGGAALFCADLDLKIGESGMIEDVQMAPRLGANGHGIDHSAEYVDMEFDAFIKEHNKEYLKGTEEYRERRKVFGANFAHIKTHNVRYEAGEVTHYLGVNEFADLTAAEFANRRGWMVGQRPRKENNDMPTDEEFAALPTSIDWTTKGVVTPVKNQGQCGSCWSFSTTGSIESRSAIASGNLISLSEQQLMDCSGSFGNQGCNGGQMDDAFKYVIENGGLSTEQCDPYQTAQESCAWKADGCQLNDPIQGYHDVQHNCEKCMMAAVAEGPVSIAVDASGMDWQLYSGGVIGSGCGQQLDHGVLAVGYGSINGQDMWKVKNSWGASWGNGGYLYIARGSDNVCGILSDPSYPCVKSAGNGDC